MTEAGREPQKDQNISYGFDHLVPQETSVELVDTFDFESWNTEYSKLSDLAPRAEFYRRLFAQDYPIPAKNRPQAAILDFYGYILYLEDAMEGFSDEAETLHLAASSAFAGLSKAVRASAGTAWAPASLRFVRRFEECLLESGLGINRKVNPHQHPDPVASAFYSELSDHLDMPVPSERYDPWG